MPEAYTHIRIARMAQELLKDSIGPVENLSAYAALWRHWRKKCTPSTADAFCAR